MGENLAAVDIGTNSIHLVVARFDDDGHFEVIADEKEAVRLGSSGGDMKELAPDAIDRGIAALTRFRQVADISSAPMSAVATSAVREAENAEDFIRRARDEADVEVEVISGVEEARLIHLGVLQAVPVFERRLLLIDIGGGSTEVLVGQQGETLAVRSFKLGAIRLTRRFFKTDRLHPGAVDACRRFVRSMLAPMARDVERAGFEVAVGSSGTIEAVVAMAHAQRRHEPTPRSLTNATVTRKEVEAVVKRLAVGGHGRQAPRAARPGTGPGRHHPRRRHHPRAGHGPLRHRRAGRVGLRPAGGRAARRVPASPRRSAPPPARPAPAQRRPPGRDDGRRARALGPRGRAGPGAVRRDRAPPPPRRRRPGAARGGGPAGQRGPVRVPQQAPQAHLLRDPELRSPLRLHRPRDRADRPRRPLPPQERAVGQARRVRRAPSRPTRTRCGRWPPSSGWPSASTGPTPGWSPPCAAPAGARPSSSKRSHGPGADLGLELYTANERKGLLEEVLGRPVRIEAVDPADADGAAERDDPAEADDPVDQPA